MPTLNWIGKEAVVNYDQQVPFHLLKDVPVLSSGEPGDGNLIVQGDNLVALKALLPYYAGQVKCIYIDPPYNTGNENWAYNDNVNSPLIREWIGKVVGGDGETLDRHDRWLCMMYPRLVLLRKFLREDGAIFISIDGNELQSLRFIMDEIFGSSNSIATVIWQKVYSPKNSARHFSEDHDYVVVYARNSEIWKPNLIPRSLIRRFAVGGATPESWSHRSMLRPTDWQSRLDAAVAQVDDTQRIAQEQALIKTMFDQAMAIPLWAAPDISAQQKGLHNLNWEQGQPYNFTFQDAWLSK